MDWKEKWGGELIAAASALLATWFIKSAKKHTPPLRRVFTNAIEIDKLKKELEDLRSETTQKEDSFKAFIDVHTSGIYYTNEHGGITYVNIKWLQITGFSTPEEAYGTGFMAAVSEEYEEEIEQINKTYFEQPRDLSGFVCFIHQQSGIKTYCRYRSKVIRDKCGKFIKGIGILEIIKN